MIQELTDRLKLNAFYKAFIEQESQPSYSDIPFANRLRMLLEAEDSFREDRRVQRLMKQAKLPIKSADINDINFTPSRNLDKGLILELSEGSYLRYKRNVLLLGPTGVGKTFISTALANRAMIAGYSALYLRIPRLMQYLQSVRGEDGYLKYLAKLKRINLLILDDFGISPLKASEARDLLEIVEDRVNQSSLIITSQLNIQDWHSYLHNPTIADAILDRVIHNSYRISLQGESQRKINANID